MQFKPVCEFTDKILGIKKLYYIYYYNINSVNL